VRDEENAYHRRSSHAGTSSLDSSSIYALLSFDSSPETGFKDCTNSDVDSLSVPASQFRPLCCKEGVHVADSVKYRHRKEMGDETDDVSVSGLISAVPNDYIDSVSIRKKKQLIVSLPSAGTCAQSKTSGGSSVKDKMPACNGLLSSGEDNADLAAASDKTLLGGDAPAAQRESNRRRYSCGDQLTATWWRFLDHATSLSDLRGLPRSLTRFCCSTWRTFTGVKSPCIDVSRASNVDPLQPGESCKLNRASACAAVTEQTVSPWWHKPLSPDRRRLIEIGSDLENSSVCEDSPAKGMSIDNALSLCETVSDSQLSDSDDDDDGGSYVSLRVDCKSTNCHKVTDAAFHSENVPSRRHSDCDILDEDNSAASAADWVAESLHENAQNRTGDIDKLFPAASVSDSTISVDAPQSLPSAVFSSTAVQPTDSSLASRSHHRFTRSLCSGASSLTRSDQFLPSNSGYINLSLGLQSSSLDSRSATLFTSGTSCHEQPCTEISAEVYSVPNLGTGSIPPLDNLAVHSTAGKERQSRGSVSSSDDSVMDKFSRRSSSRLLQLIRRSSTKAQKQHELPATSSAAAAENYVLDDSSTVGSTDSVSVASLRSCSGNSQPALTVHRLPSPNGPPPPVPDDSTTSRLFTLCHTERSSISERLSMDVSIDSGLSSSQYEDLRCPVAKTGATLSASYSAGDRRHCDGMQDSSSDSARLLAPTSAYRHGRWNGGF